jgi:N-terminal domain of anti-restriction factor ArdC
MSIEDVNKKLDEGLESIFKSERFNELLQVMSRFHNYSLNNAMLIMTQRPNATMVMGYKGWQELGRFVKKGEKQIKILAPMFKKFEVEKIDPITNKPVLDDYGNPVKEKIDKLIGFKMVGVFDVSQTDGKEIPSVRDFINSQLQNDEVMSKLYKDYFNHIKDHYNYIIREDITDSGVGGYFDRRTNEIVISTNNNQNDTEKFRVLVHEFAHAKLHHIDSELKNLPRGHKEAQAECVAYIVSNYFGLDTDDVSLGYIATWSQDIKLARQALEEVQKVAKEIIYEIEELQKDKVLEFYQDNNNEYNNVLEYLKNRFSISTEDISETNYPQFEVLNKKNNLVVSAKMEYSERTEKFILRTEKNIIIPLSELDRNGDYAILNKELENGKLIEVSEYQRVPDLLEVTDLGNGKYAVTSIGGTDLYSKEYTNKEDAEKHLLRIALTQSLHHQAFLKTQLHQEELKDLIQGRIHDNNMQINFDVSKYLTHNTNHTFIPSGEDGTTIGWTLLKNKNITDIEQLRDFAFNQTKHLPTYNKLREAIDNSYLEFNKKNNEKEPIAIELER